MAIEIQILEWRKVEKMNQKVEQLAIEFRMAIEKVKEAGEFETDFSFSKFPSACCGDASDLLAQYLLENGIKSTYVCGNRYFNNPKEGTQSHAWLLVNGLIVDITGDQFKYNDMYYNYDIKVYVGKEDAFHSLFEVEERDIHEFYGLENYDHTYQSRLFDLYEKIKRYC